MKRISTALTFAALMLTFVAPVQAKNVKTRKVQEVNFSEMNLNGTVRNPDGAYLVQKRGLKFQPLYKVKESIDQKIRRTSMYLD